MKQNYFTSFNPSVNMLLNSLCDSWPCCVFFRNKRAYETHKSIWHVQAQLPLKLWFIYTCADVTQLSSKTFWKSHEILEELWLFMSVKLKLFIKSAVFFVYMSRVFSQWTADPFSAPHHMAWIWQKQVCCQTWGSVIPGLLSASC